MVKNKLKAFLSSGNSIFIIFSKKSIVRTTNMAFFSRGCKLRILMIFFFSIIEGAAHQTSFNVPFLQRGWNSPSAANTLEEASL